MSKYTWRFPKLDGGLEQGVNNGGIATFKGSKLYDNLAREICQNSLDAKADGKETVVVKFNSLKLKKSDYPSLNDLSAIFDDCREYWKERMEPKLERFLSEADKTIKADSIDFLAISDYNTTGLSGAKAKKMEKSKWRALTHSDGVTDKSNGSGGSYGIGKNAPFACSSLRTVFYNSYSLDDGIKAFQGVARLITHLDKGQETIGVGFYQNAEDMCPIFAEDSCKIRDVFNRDEPGTDVIIAGFNSLPTWKEDIEKAVISNFFVAITNKTLEVHIDDIELNALSIKDRIKYYADIEKKINDKEKRITTILEFYQTITEPDFVEKGKILEDDDVYLYIKKNDEFSKTIAEMRSIGMVVRLRKNNVFTRYAAVMVVQPGKLNNILKEIEPPTHDKWDAGLIEDDPKKAKEAQDARRRLIAWVNNQIVEKCRGEEQEEIDLEGMSAFLPYDEDDKILGADSENDISPDGEAKVDGAEKKKSPLRKETLTAKKVKGTKDSNSTPHNDGHGGKKGGLGGHEDPDGDDMVSAPVSGQKSVTMPKVSLQRVSKTLNDSQYRIVFMLEEDCEVVHVALSALRDDGRKDKVNIIGYKDGHKIIPINTKQLVIRNVKANVLKETFVVLEYSERMTLELLLY